MGLKVLHALTGREDMWLKKMDLDIFHTRLTAGYVLAFYKHWTLLKAERASKVAQCLKCFEDCIENAIEKAVAPFRLASMSELTNDLRKEEAVVACLMMLKGSIEASKWPWIQQLTDYICKEGGPLASNYLYSLLELARKLDE